MPIYLYIVEWSNNTDGYSVSNENKTATRLSGLTRVLYSSSQSYMAGHPISFRVMGTGEKSPMDGLAITLDNDDTDTLKREGVIFVATDGMWIQGSQALEKYSKTCLKRPLKEDPLKSFQAQYSKVLQNAPVEHSAVLLNCIELPHGLKAFVLSIFHWPLKTGFTVLESRGFS